MRTSLFAVTPIESFSNDATLPGWIALRVADNPPHGGVLYYDLQRFKANQIGVLAKAIVAALIATEGNLANR